VRLKEKKIFGMPLKFSGWEYSTVYADNNFLACATPAGCDIARISLPEGNGYKNLVFGAAGGTVKRGGLPRMLLYRRYSDCYL
jgi:hypothetical protein